MVQEPPTHAVQIKQAGQKRQASDVNNNIPNAGNFLLVEIKVTPQKRHKGPGASEGQIVIDLVEDEVEAQPEPVQKVQAKKVPIRTQKAPVKVG